MSDVSELDKALAALARERIAVETARGEAQHWKDVAFKLGEQVEELKRKRGK